ncbi:MULTISPECIES: molybdenum cofactor biosynthesis F family protein [Pseudomonas aeruginosa group]|uniref:Molybdenum cofactor biosynthesis protein F n=1 Tax=Pseudomonas aeruginosa TaxID=287 RepID=A0ABD7JY27_PSEAI|nr:MULTISPECIES: molybdenum cofactor biosynthesis F family protein [Pseudomonas aeruginosa group]KFF36408.1 moaF [Pseudomonas aeruginosa VRFPA01]KSC36457.1 molybdenum cofactor biosynthesis protein F [Pseudomonas paraeruginosa]KSL03691.1 molybdenum cofactor biosynthesis protein F [Pseudomonas aeruginosa]MBH8712880.1 molybdenum cofactor biosynthesis F family protein [Pseudomonas aeruginosa]MBI8115550.1 molybdenum cofactor biosynthesis F family protein [Pseudomonas aeruginosa]
MPASPHPEWITVGALADGFAPDSHVLPASLDLDGRELVLHFANGWIIQHAFGQQRLRWRLADGSVSGESAYRASSLRENIYLVDFLKQEDGRTVSVSLVLDFHHLAFTAVLGRLPTRATCEQGLFSRALSGQEPTGVEAGFLHGSLGRPWQPGACPHAPSEELLGLRNQYVYSASEAYEHIYLNPRFYTWHCLRGAEQGLADTDRCHHYRLAERLYLFVWREKIVPTLGVLLIDLEAGRTDGKIFGYQGDDFATPVNFPVGALARVLGQTRHEQ